MIALAWFTCCQKNNHIDEKDAILLQKSNSESYKVNKQNDQEFCHDSVKEKIRIYHCTVSDNNPVT